MEGEKGQNCTNKLVMTDGFGDSFIRSFFIHLSTQSLNTYSRNRLLCAEHYIVGGRSVNKIGKIAAFLELLPGKGDRLIQHKLCNCGKC